MNRSLLDYPEIDDYYTYNARNQLVVADTPEGVTEYTYRPDGLRQSKNALTHVWDGSNIVADVDGGSVTRYIRGVNLLFSEGEAGTNYYLYNAHGDVVQLTNEDGEVVREYDYDAFGVERDADENDINPFRFCAEYYDVETGTIYLRNRVYDPRTGRFTSEDPIGAGLNYYTYCENNPIFFVDPNGLEPSEAEWQQIYNIAHIMQALSAEMAIEMQRIADELMRLAHQLSIMDGPLPFMDMVALLPVAVVLSITAELARQNLAAYWNVLVTAVWDDKSSLGTNLEHLSKAIGDLVGNPKEAWAGIVLQYNEKITAVAKENYDPNPYARPGQKKQERERREKKREKSGFEDRSNKRNGPAAPKHHTPGKDHRKY